MLQLDGMANVITGIGTRADKISADTFIVDLVTQAEIDAAYSTSTWFRKIVKIPVEDSLKKNWTWLAKSEQVVLLEKEQKRLQVIPKFMEAMIRARKDGGAVIYMGGLPGSPETPLNINQVGKGAIKYLLVGTKEYFTAKEIDRNIGSPNFGAPLMWTLTGSNGSVDIHPSRVIQFVGEKPMTSWATTYNNGHGDSVYQTLRRALLNSDSTALAIAHLMSEAKTDIIKIPGLTEICSTDNGEQQLVKRFIVANQLKGLVNALLIDAASGDGEAGEEWEQKQVNFAGLPDVQMMFIQLLAGAADIPATRLLGKSPDGMNATGESDLKNYYDRIASDQELDLSPLLDPFFEIFLRHVFGSRPADVWYKWESLFDQTPEQKSKIEETYSKVFKTYVEAGIVETQILSEVAKNRMVESGNFPGMEEAIRKYEDPESLEPMDDPDDLDADIRPREKKVTADAEPRPLYVRRDVVNKEDIIAWAVSQGYERSEIVPDLHVTILYSRQAVDWMKMGNDLWGQELKVPAGGPRIMEQFGNFEVLTFAHNQLTWRHADMVQNGASHDYPDYQPHISIVKNNLFAPIFEKVQPYTGEIVLGPEIFEVAKP